MARVRAKFWVRSVERIAAGAGQYQRIVKLNAVSKHGPKDPADNGAFWSATPIGELAMTLTQTGAGAGEVFEEHIGGDCYLTFDFDEAYTKCQARYERRRVTDSDGSVSEHAFVVHEPSCSEYVEGGVHDSTCPPIR